MLEMNPEIRARWAAALRSGEYEQTREKLHTNEGWCCLGVLCDLAVKSGLPVVVTKPAGYSYDGEACLLPRSVLEWAGLSEATHARNAWVDTPVFGRIDLATLNDDGMPFTEIADLIDGGAS